MALHVSTPSDRGIQVRRTFAAPRQFVWDAHTKPELIKRWLTGPDGWSMPECEVDLRVGGAYRYVWRNDASGAQFSAGGVHKEIAPIERIVTTERMDLSGLGMESPSEDSLNTLVLNEIDGVTTLTLTMRFASKEARDAALASGMTDGMETSYRRLEGLLS